MSEPSKTSVKDILGIVISSIALILSIFSLYIQNFWQPHHLKASIVNIEHSDTTLATQILVINSGKHYETIYQARFILADDLSNGGGSLSKDIVGPIVIQPGQAVVLKLSTPALSFQKYKEEGVISQNASGIHVGVNFLVVDENGTLKDKIYRITEFKYQNGEQVGAKPKPGDNADKFIDLL